MDPDPQHCMAAIIVKATKAMCKQCREPEPEQYNFVMIRTGTVILL
jgi:hypothetical protein